ncbi:MAG: XrtN system VIT domain-containing protein [Sphingobacteriales bacterium]|nr:MAG: XrtN system VIT domain-containing protein [Sphingobacteriales bacterium]
MQENKPIYKDGLFITGIILISISAFIFYLPEILPQQERQNFFSFFFINYAIAVFYLIVLWGRGVAKLKWRFMLQSITWYIPAIILLLISAYALNREINVFQVSVDWLNALLVIQCTNLLLFSIYDKLPKWFRMVMFFILGAGLVLFCYLAVYVAPLYAIGLVAFIFLGISGHAFVPLLFVISILILFRKFSRNQRNIILPFVAGIILPFITGIYFAIQWNNITNIIDKEYTQSLINENDLPAWVRISQRLPKNSVTEKVLKAGMIYTIHENDGNFFWSPPNRSFDEQKKHDPLVVFASLFNYNSELNETEKIKILESVYDSRHQAQERLWSGENLRTRQVISNVRLWPEYRMAYTEKILSIENTGIHNWWNNTEEALYTFHLPEGAVVTSLSLWINGKEEKGYLTSKQKADTAYQTIVGVENRDPSVVHWQEGNTVTVRVFPCTREENRRFKIGITSPLQVIDNDLVYNNIYFDGPIMNDAKETRLINSGNEILHDISFSTEKTPDGNYEFEGGYNAEWEIKIPLKPLAYASFAFGGKNYEIQEYKQQLIPADINKIYLDLNAAWNEDEVQEILASAKGKPIYAWLGKWFEVNKENYTELLKDFEKLQFSMFPLYEIKDRANSLLITKGTTTSPNLNDVSESNFHKGITKLAIDTSPLKTFCLGDDPLSPYMKTLKEFRMIQAENGEIKDLKNIIEKNIFPKNQEDNSHLQIKPAQIIITETAQKDKTVTKAPDHFFRLFAYNQIMKNAGAESIHKNFTDTNLVALAQKAYVVSPVSSLIVLETQADYERFGIEESKNSLGNASMKSSGAVPEPHEWALIGLVLITLTGFLYGKKLRQIWIP